LMGDTKDGARRWFDRRAGSYEGGVTSRWRDPVQRGSLEALELRADDTLLDVGCGTGAASRMAAPAVRSVVGVDLSGAMIDAAIGLAAGLDHVRFLLDAGLGHVQLRRLRDGGFAIVRGVR